MDNSRDREYLMGYLQAVCDGEAALAACRETTRALEMQRAEIKDTLTRPVKPYYSYIAPVQEKETSAQGCGKSVCGVFLAALFLFIGLIIIGKGIISPFLSLPFIIIAVIFGYILGTKIADAPRKANYREQCDIAESSAKSKYEMEMRRYQKELDDIARTEQNNYLIKEELACIIAENMEKEQQIQNELATLYGKNIIKEKFRTMAAVNQIYEYLDVGVCETLEGVNGAYAMYYSDIRADRICGEIEDLRRSVERGMRQIMSNQGTLWQAIKDVDNSVNLVQDSLGNSINSLKNSMGRISDGLSGIQNNIERNAEAASKQREEIRSTLAVAAHNQYVDLREKGMNVWMLQNP